jgi:outer membrane protein assembly factor BamB
MARKRLFLSLTTFVLIIASLVVLTADRTANVAPASQKNTQASASGAKQANVYLSTSSTSITALNATTGATLWTFRPGSYVDPPTTIKQIVYAYVLRPFDTLYALNLSTGSTLWTFHPDGFLNLPVFNNAVYVTVDSAISSSTTLYKLDATTGATIWTFQPGVQLSSAALISKGVAYITSANVGPIYALLASNGKQLWQFQPTGGQLTADEVVGGVLYVDEPGPEYSFGVLFAYSIKDRSLLWSTDARLWTVVNNITYVEGGTYANPEMCALNSVSGTQRWCIPGYELIVADGLAYITTDTTAFTVFNASNGMQVWSTNQNQFVTLNQGVVYTVNANHAVEARKATNGALLWASSDTNGIATTFLIANGKIYADSANHTALYSLDATNGALRWSFSLSSGVSSLTIAHGIILILTYNNTIYALQASNGKLLWQH